MSGKFNKNLLKLPLRALIGEKAKTTIKWKVVLISLKKINKVDQHKINCYKLKCVTQVLNI